MMATSEVWRMRELARRFWWLERGWKMLLLIYLFELEASWLDVHCDSLHFSFLRNLMAANLSIPSMLSENPKLIDENSASLYNGYVLLVFIFQSTHFWFFDWSVLNIFNDSPVILKLHPPKMAENHSKPSEQSSFDSLIYVLWPKFTKLNSIWLKLSNVKLNDKTSRLIEGIAIGDEASRSIGVAKEACCGAKRLRQGASVWSCWRSSGCFIRERLKFCFQAFWILHLLKP